MPTVSPFVGLTYAPSAGPLERLTARPYDVITDDYRRGYLAGSPNNIVHVDLAEGSDDPDEPGNRYETAGAVLAGWRASGVLQADENPLYYAYEMSFPLGGKRRRIRGIYCALELEPWGGGVLPHEETMPGPIQDRLHLLRATRTHLSPIYGTVAGPSAPLAALLEDATAGPAPFEITDTEGVDHRMWRVDGTAPVAEWLAGEPLLIADGHHRYTTALAYRDERHAADGAGPWDRILALIVDSGTEDVPVLPYHRILVVGAPPAGGAPTDSLESALQALSDTDLRFATVARGSDGSLAFRIHTAEGEPPTVKALHRSSLDRLAPGDALRFTHEAVEAVEAVRDGEAVAAYLLPTTTPGRIREVVDRHERLPRKSTFFWPKPRTGMVLMPLDLERPSIQL
jgi:uncharacterized protein (DUF1015 family)